MKINIRKNFFILIFIFIAPWFNANYFDSIEPPSNTKDYTFYEANPCKISLFEFAYANKNFSELKLVGDNYSSILCFGRISQIKDSKTLSIGTNFLVSTSLYLVFFIFLLKNKTPKKIVKLKPGFLKVSNLSLLITLLIFSDRKFYETKLYFLDPFKFRTYVFIYIFLFAISILLMEVYAKKQHHFINLIPYLLIFSGTVLKSNLNIFSIIIVYLGIEAISLNKNYLNFFKFYMLINCIWTLNARNTYIIPENIYPGFSSTSYDFYSIFFYSIFFILFLFGSHKFIFDNTSFFSYRKFIKNFSIVILIKITFGFLDSRLNFVEFITNFFNPQNTKSILYFDFFNLFRVDERAISLFIIIFLYKFVTTRSLETVDSFPILIILFVLINFSNFISVIKSKIKLTIDFFDIYNPTFLELVFGSGPSNFNQLYFESNYRLILNQHSFINSLLLFFGLLGVVLSLIIVNNFFKVSLFNNQKLFFIFLLLGNFILSDSTNYLPIFLTYILFFLVFKKDNLNL
tara:strand:- start:257 stop:1804 length:1548 start_codon:yes stop_codon:yes gene_type:complete